MTKEEYLLSLANKYKTDKLEHGYIPFYAKYLPDQIRAMLEIGVFHGSSARMFDEFYDHRPDVHLLDLFMEPGNMTPREARRLEFIPHEGSQSELSFLSTITTKFDFIEEDGSHNSFDQIASFKHFFINNLKGKGLWVTEDLHCATDPFYWSNREEIKSVDDTMLGLVKKYIATGKIDNPFFNTGESEVFENIIDKMELCCEDKIVFIWRR